MLDLKQAHGRVTTSPAFSPTFRLVALGVLGANNKPLVGLINTGDAVVSLWRAWVKNVQQSAVTGILSIFELKRISGVAAFTGLTPDSLDTTDVPAPGVTCFTGGTVTGEAPRVISRQTYSSDEWGPGTADVESAASGFQAAFPSFSFGPPPLKPLVLRTGQGFMVVQRAASAPGTWDLEVEFTSD